MTAHRVIVIGGGGSGIPFAVRLAETDRVDVLLLEAGPAWRSTRDAPPHLAATLNDASNVVHAAPGNALAWSYTTNLYPGRRHEIARGRVLGGSTAINGAYFMRPHPDDFADWAGVAGEEWTYANALPALKRLEHDVDFPNDVRHGDAGPIPVARPNQNDDITRAFMEATGDRGHPQENDKNAGGNPGTGALPLNALEGSRWSTARAYLSNATHPRLTIRGGATVRRVLFEGTRAIGVEYDEGGSLRREYADEVVISAGAIETPRLLLRSGVGPAPHGSAAASWKADLPGVGHNLSDHPVVTLDWTARDAATDIHARAPWTAALNFSVPGGAERGDLEILLSVMPTACILTGTYRDGPVGLRVALQTPQSRGTVHPEGDVAAVNYQYLQRSYDRGRIRAGVREGLHVLRSRPFAPVVAEIHAPSEDLYKDDAFADAWIRDQLSTSMHSSGTARMGEAGDPGAVTDPHGRVFGVDRLRVVDTSLLPAVPSRGTAATAVFLGERLAELWNGEHEACPER